MTLDDLTVPLSINEAKAAFYATLESTGVSTTNWKPGAVVRTIITGFAILVAACSALISVIARGSYLELASGSWLRLRAKDVYDVDFRDATFALGVVHVANAGGGVYTYDPDQLVLRNSATGALYHNTSSVTIAALAADTVIAISANEAGAASTALVGEISLFVGSTPLGLTVTNTETIIGLDQEEDPELRARCSEKLGALSPMGPPDAYAFAAKNAKLPDGTPVGVTRVRVVKDGTGTLLIYVATATGAVAGLESDPTTPLGAVADAIQRQAAGLNDTAVVATATPLTVNVTYAIWIYNTFGLTLAQLQAVIASELAAFFAEQPIGGNILGILGGQLYNEAIKTRIAAARTPQGVPLNAINITLSSPGGDTPVAINAVPVLGTIGAGSSITQVPLPGASR